MTVSQSCCCLKGYAAELVHIAVKLIFGHRASVQILHQLVVAMLSVYVGLTEIVNLHYHFEVEVKHRLQYLAIYVEVGIVNLKHVFLLVFFNQEYLRLTRILAKNLLALIVLTTQHKYAIIYLGTLLLELIGSLSAAGRRYDRDIYIRTNLWLNLRLNSTSGSTC